METIHLVYLSDFEEELGERTVVDLTLTGDCIGLDRLEDAFANFLERAGYGAVRVTLERRDG